MSFLGAILPAWQHHISSEYGVVGLYFLGLIAGLLASVCVAPRLLERKGIGWTLAFACAHRRQRVPLSGFRFASGFGVVARRRDDVLGFAAGLLHTAMFHAVSPMYRHDPAATVNLAGILFGLGCLHRDAADFRGVLRLYGAALQAWIAVIPALFGWMYLKDAVSAAACAASPCRARDLLRTAQSRRRYCWRCCCSFNSAMNGLWPDG